MLSGIYCASVYVNNGLHQARSSGSQSGEWGSGSGKGGGGGGSVREAGGAFGKMEAAREEEYFRKLQAQQITVLKEHIEDEIKQHEKLIKQHQEEIERHKKKIRDLKEH
ncbi:ATPase inhibitor, mitochondrial-like isoform X2 [Dermacentor albipictus]|uniref:ATPase inhibitor, mitochondrial-like isoform X2 n=1 Tax=Dermacentor albipictus TaxID=60249 RepID=UPI0031FBBEBA